MSQPLRRILAGVARAAVDAVLPPLCLSCNSLVAEAGALCGDCWEKVTFLGPPHCAACGHPFEFETTPDALCAACVAKPAPYGRARAVFRYDEGSKALLLGFKHADRIEAAPAFARWMNRAGAGLLEGADLLVPVPLHPTRLFARRYNQAALLALALAELAGKRAAPRLLMRRRRTPLLGHMGRDQRSRTVKGAFAVREADRPLLQGAAVVLVDDVLTTGATVGECAKVLRKAGARSVDVLTLGRVVLG